MTKPKSQTSDAKAPLTVTPLEREHFRFLVASRTVPGREYLVDLEAFAFNGACGCRRWEIACGPRLRRGESPCEALRCSHIRRARSFFLDVILPKLATELKRNGKH